MGFVQLIKNNDGKSRGYAFVTMASGDEAQAVIDKFDSKVTMSSHLFKCTIILLSGVALYC